MTSEFWLETDWGESFDNASIFDVNEVIKEILKMDEEKGIFWIGHIEKEYILEIHKNLILFFIYGENQNKKLKVHLDNWEVFRAFTKRFFDKDFLGIKNELKLASFIDSFKNDYLKPFDS